MTREELKPALEWAQQVAEDKNGAKDLFSATGDMEICARFVTTQKHVTSLASALREAWEEIDRHPSGSFGRKERKRDHFVDVTKMVAAKEER